MNKLEWLAKLKIPSEYYAGAGKRFLSNSNIATLLSDPSSFGEDKRIVITHQLIQGSYLHDSLEDKITGSKIVEEHYTVVDEPREFLSPERPVITSNEVKECQGWVSSLWNNKTVQKLLEGSIEVEAPAIGEINNTPWKCKYDLINHDKKIIVDWKTTGGAIDGFGKYAYTKWNYDSGGYVYKTLAEQMYGEEYSMVYPVVSKKSGDIAIYFPTENQYYSGRDKTNQAIQNYKLFCK